MVAPHHWLHSTHITMWQCKRPYVVINHMCINLSVVPSKFILFGRSQPFTVTTQLQSVASTRKNTSPCHPCCKKETSFIFNCCLSIGIYFQSTLYILSWSPEHQTYPSFNYCLPYLLLLLLCVTHFKPKPWVPNLWFL